MLSVGSVFSGIGLLDYGLHLAGLEHRWLCEVDQWRRSILGQRFPGVPVIEDVRAVGSVRCERVDVIAGGFPCKGASTAGKQEGFGHPETVLWREMFRAVRELRPRYVVVENVANLLAIHDGAVWGEVVGDLASLGFDIEWDCIPAAAVGAPHLRDRVFAVATHHEGKRAGEQADVAHAITGGRDARLELARGVCPPAPDPSGNRVRQQSEPERGSGGPSLASGAGEDAAHADGAGRLERGGTVTGASQLAAVERAGEDAPDATRECREGARAGWEALGGAARDRGVPVSWGEYQPAIARWEVKHGPAPEPLVRRVDDRSAARVERSRLSALGDGVQVQVGQLVGAYLMSLEGQ